MRLLGCYELRNPKSGLPLQNAANLAYVARNRFWVEMGQPEPKEMKELMNTVPDLLQPQNLEYSQRRFGGLRHEPQLPFSTLVVFSLT